MKHALALIFLSCVLVAQDKPTAESPKPAAAETPAEAKPKIQPINVRDELIELIHTLKTQASRRVSYPFVSMDGGLAFANMYGADMKAKTEAQRLLLEALVVLSKDAEKEVPMKAYHSSNPLTTGMSR